MVGSYLTTHPAFSNLATTPHPLYIGVAGRRNLALDKPAWQSSTVGNHVAVKALDGNTRPNLWHDSCTHTMHDDNPWWIVDLQSEHVITEVQITNRLDCCRKHTFYHIW